MKHWHPLPELVDRALQHCDNNPTPYVLDIGASDNFTFPKATHAVGWNPPSSQLAKPLPLNLDSETLPFPDQSCFVYSRHTIEDLANPSHILAEIRRVAVAGWIETPSPQAELTRGVDAYGNHLGYAHHRWICHSAQIAADRNLLTLLAKYPIVEQLPLPDHYPLLENPLAWNTTHQWTGTLAYQILQNEQGFHLCNLSHIYDRPVPEQYLDVVNRLLNNPKPPYPT